MAKISTKSDLFRERKEIIADVTFALNTQQLHFAAKRAVIDQAIWVWSEYEGKYSPTLFWSPKARTAKRKGLPIIHEHPVPRQVVRDKLFELKNPTAVKVAKVFRSYCLGAVIAKSEDECLNKNGLRSKMPPDWDGRDVWARYRAIGINAP